MNLRYLFIIIALMMPLQGCSVKEAAKRIVGTSTQTLQDKASQDGISKAFHCSYEDCFEAIMRLGRYKPSAKPWVKPPEIDEGVFDIFMSDLYASPPYIIVMGVEGSVNTTEVGIFFTRTSLETIRVDVSSLASTAKRTVARIVFEELGTKFQVAE
ncbi:MAG TPA: hypothetical protein VI749_03755 [Candidatus Omnitrophota bacterium]|nr:hypothetical protein [Candidatus Omnitrophota bacterium]